MSSNEYQEETVLSGSGSTGSSAKRSEMTITCPHCQREHTIDMAKIPQNAHRARCKICDSRFELSDAVQTQEAFKPVEATVPHASKKTRSIGVALTKGGVGKTTTSVNLAAGLAHAGYKVLIVDTDTQDQVRYMLGAKPKAGLSELLSGDLPAEEAVHKARENLWLLSGGRSLAGVKRMIDRKDFGGEQTLSEAFKTLEKSYDFVIVDTSPGWDSLTVNVLFYVREVLIPVSLEIMTLHGLVEFFRNVAAIKKYREELAIRYLVPTFLDMRVKKKATKFMDKLEQHYAKYLCPPIRYNNILSQTPMYGKTIYEYAPGSKGAKDYQELIRNITGNERLFAQK
jgi:chromosome partitioning protein